MRQTSHEGAILWHVCGRYYRTEDKQQLVEYFQAIMTGDPLTYAPGYNIAPTTIQPVLRLERDTNFRELVPMRWGLVGFGSSGPDPKRSTFNARAEGLESSNLWRRPLHRQRALIPASGFFEWRKGGDEARTAEFFHLAVLVESALGKQLCFVDGHSAQEGLSFGYSE
jgi:putative SOS response-associated peptidase YedK